MSMLLGFDKYVDIILVCLIHLINSDWLKTVPIINTHSMRIKD
jgi:hypothetical protein